jgi:hypothetical protein
MHTVFEKRDGVLDLAGSEDSVSPRFAAGDPVLLGDIVSLLVSDLSVRMSGNFNLPRVIARAPAGRSNRRPRY